MASGPGSVGFWRIVPFRWVPLSAILTAAADRAPAEALLPWPVLIGGCADYTRRTLNRREWLLAAASLVLLAAALVRIAAPERPPLRALSVGSFEVREADVPPGQTVTLEAHWSPPSDVYVMGWNPWFGLPPGAVFDAELMVYQRDAKATVFVTGQRGAGTGALDVWRHENLPAGTGYLVRKGQPLTLRYRVENGGPALFATRGATALLYFVTAEGN